LALSNITPILTNNTPTLTNIAPMLTNNALALTNIAPILTNNALTLTNIATLLTNSTSFLTQRIEASLRRGPFLLMIDECFHRKGAKARRRRKEKHCVSASLR
jgi:hypothetical protein